MSNFKKTALYVRFMSSIRELEITVKRGSVYMYEIIITIYIDFVINVPQHQVSYIIFTHL